MTEDQEAALIRDHHDAGRNHAAEVADLMHTAFPSRSTRHLRRKIKRAVTDSFSNMQNTLREHGIEAPYRQHCAVGFVAGLKERDPELASYIDNKVSH